MKWRLIISAIVAVLSVPAAALWATALPGSTVVGPMIAIGAGFYASLILTKSPTTRRVLQKLETYKPSDEFIDAWEEAGTVEKRNWRGKPTGARVERGGFSWIFQATKTILSQLWGSHRKWTVVGGALFGLFVISAISGVPVLSVVGAALGLYLFTAAVFTVITVLTEENPPSDPR